MKDKLWEGAGVIRPPPPGSENVSPGPGRFSAFGALRLTKLYLCKTGEIRKKTGLGARGSICYQSLS